MKRLFFIFSLATMALTSQAQVYLDENAPIEERVQDALSRMTVHEKVAILHAQSKFTSGGVPRLGIPQLNMDDGPHGVREELNWNDWAPAHWTNDSVVAFPTLTCLAATWNRSLSALYGKAVSEEFAYRGKNVMLGPGCTMARMPLCGRNFEYMGEDPYLAGEMVVPYIQAAQKNGVACCLKHFFLNNQERWRFGVNVNVSERAVEEIYLPAFHKAVEKGHVWSIMGSYNKWQNNWCCENDSLLNGILKGRWAFDGAVISDWGGTHTTNGAAYGGLDIEMGTDTNGKTEDHSLGYGTYRLADNFEKAVNEGRIPMSILNDKAARVLRLIFRTALGKNTCHGKLCSEDHYAACEQIGEEGIVLLKNSPLAASAKDGGNILPLTPEKMQGKRILVVGDNATREMSYGGGSSELKTKYDISPLAGLKAVYGDAVDYAQGYKAGKPMYAHVDPVAQETQDSLREEALRKAKDADIIIFIGGLNKNHRQDCEDGDRENYSLSFGQDELISQLAKIQKNIVVVTYGGNAFATPWISQVPAMLHCWYLGSMSGTSLANIISGKVNPSGKLPVTFAKRQSDYPCFQYGEEGYPGVVTGAANNDDYSGDGKQVYYKEGIYMGYRWFDTKKVQPQFPFGYGLSYTTFKYGKATVSSPTMTEDGTITVTVPVTNTGDREGKEVVEFYISDDKCSIDRPAKELKGFEKLALAPGETKTATFTITADDLKFYDEAAHCWKAEPGKFKAHVAASETDIRSTVGFELKAGPTY